MLSRSLLAVKLRGRPTTCPGCRAPTISTGPRGSPVWPIGRQGRTIFPCARGTRPQGHHGPLQRLSGDTFVNVKGSIPRRLAESKSVYRVADESEHSDGQGETD